MEPMHDEVPSQGLGTSWREPTPGTEEPGTQPTRVGADQADLTPATGGSDGHRGRGRMPTAVFIAAVLTIAVGSSVALGALWSGNAGVKRPSSAPAAVESPTATLSITTATPAPVASSEPIASSEPVILENGAADDVEAVLAIDVDAATVAERVVPSVVYVEVSRTGRGGQSMTVASGSGVILDAEGHIVTNNHVVASGSGYRVVLSDGRTYAATLIGFDEVTDLALLDIAADDLDPIELGSSDALSVGDAAVAVGSPLGLQGGPSLTVGVVSAFGREVDTSTSSLYGMLQTDAAITEGSSGGALVDADGHLVGITTAVGVSSVGVEGIGFATPVEIVARVVGELATSGQATQPGLGITGETAYRELADGGQAPVGVRLVSVGSGSAAAAAGLQAGDVVSRIGSVSIDTMEELVATLRRFAAGDTVTLTIDGTGSERTVTVVLQDL